MMKLIQNSMRYYRVCFSFFLLMQAATISASAAGSNSADTLLSDARQVAQLLFNPVRAGGGGKENPYPVISLNQAAIDLFFLKNLMQSLLNFYCLAKLSA